MRYLPFIIASVLISVSASGDAPEKIVKDHIKVGTDVATDKIFEFDVANEPNNPRLRANYTTKTLDISQDGVNYSPITGQYLFNAQALIFHELTTNGVEYIGLKAPNSLSGNTTFTLPTADGTPNQALTTDGSTNLGWSSIITNPMGAGATLGVDKLSDVAGTGGPELTYGANLPVGKEVVNYAAVTFTNGTDVVNLTSHNFLDWEPIYFGGTGTLPTIAPSGSLVAGTIYYTRDVAANTFKLASTLGGAAIDLTSDGSGTIYVYYARTALEVTTPYFYTYKAGGTDQTIADETVTKVTFNTEVADNYSSYDASSSHIFVIPRTGLWWVGYALAVSAGSDDPELINCWMRYDADTTTRHGACSFRDPVAFATNFRINCQGNALRSFTAGQEISVWCVGDNTADTADIVVDGDSTLRHSYFYGYMIK